jgi:hypothetical protein
MSIGAPFAAASLDVRPCWVIGLTGYVRMTAATIEYPCGQVRFSVHELKHVLIGT